MPSQRETVLQFAFTAANGSGKPVGLKVERMRLTQIETSEIPHLNIRPSDETVDFGKLGPRAPAVMRSLSFVAEARTLATGSTSADASADAVLLWANTALQADITLGGNAVHIVETGTKWVAEDTGSGKFCLATRTYAVLYPTKRLNEGSKP